MLMPVAECNHRHRHILPYSSGRCVAQTRRQINANACGCMQPQVAAWISVLVWAMRRPESRDTYADAWAAGSHRHQCRFHQFSMRCIDVCVRVLVCPCVSFVCVSTFPDEEPPKKVGTYMLVLVVVCMVSNALCSL